MNARTLDHVAFWATERDAIADILTAQLGMHVIDRQDAFTLVGSDARRGKLTLFDAEGPCGNAVKDAQRTKTDAQTRRTLTLIWGTTELPGDAAKAEAWYRELLQQLGATTENVAQVGS